MAETGVAVATCVFAWDIAQSSQLLADGSLAYTGVHTGMGDVVFAARTPIRSVEPPGSTRPSIVLADAVEVDGTPTRISPRQILRDQLARLEVAGLTASVGDRTRVLAVSR